MLGYMNREALEHTQETGLVTFWSRSRSELWQKGMTSGHVLHLVAIYQDCDSDALLVLAEPAGPTCHTGRPSCFFRDLDGELLKERVPATIILSQLADTIAARRARPSEDSYTARLLTGGVDRIGKKIGEEAAEVIIAAKNNSVEELTYEMADLLYHSLVLLECQGVPLSAVLSELQRRAMK